MEIIAGFSTSFFHILFIVGKQYKINLSLGLNTIREVFGDATPDFEDAKSIR